MTAGVFGQVVAAHKAPVTHRTDKFLLARVRASVARELVGAGELLVTAVPAAAERLLPYEEPRQDKNETSGVYP